MKCFCGKPATYHVKVVGSEDYKYHNHPRCTACKEKAERSYPLVESTKLDIEQSSK